ncbi:MAG: CHAT domain-containing protein, partial [Cyanobacteria bacterium P01_A01_bin.68]
RIKGNKADNIEKAIAFYNAALEVRTRNEFPQDWATTQINLANAYKNRGKESKADNIENAITFSKAALEVYTRNDFPQRWAMTQNNLANAYIKRVKGNKADNIENAIACYQNALTVFTFTTLPIKCLKTARNLGNLLLQIQRWEQAINAYDKAIQAVELSRSWTINNTHRQEIIEEAIDVYKHIVQACIKNGQPEKAVEYAERSKARNLVELVYDSQVEPKGSIPQKQQVINEFKLLRRQIEDEKIFISSQEEQYNNKKQNQREAENQQLEKVSRQYLEQLQEQLDELIETKIKPYDPSFSLTQKVKPIQFNEIKSLLDKNTAIIEWYITDEKIIAFIIARGLKNGNKIKVWQSNSKYVKKLFMWKDEYLQDYYDEDRYKKKQSRIKKCLKKLLNNQYKDKNQQWQNKLGKRLSKLAEILHINELIAQIPEDCDRLILIPHNFLHIFPLHALEAKNSEYSTNQCLLELFPRGVSYAPSCQLLQLAKNQQRNDFTSLFAIQTPTEDLYEKDLGAVAVIKKQFTHPYVSKKTKAKKLSILKDEKFLKANNAFFFCHGFFNTKSPLDSGLILADNNLTLDDLFTQLKLENCRLVTLSACETGLIDFNNISDEYIGLPSGFLFAGSTNIISSLWTVSATATALLMMKFYSGLQYQNSIVISLNKAQIWLRDTTIKGFKQWIKQSLLEEEWQEELENYFTEMESKRGANYKPFESPYFWSAFCAIGKGE